MNSATLSVKPLDVLPQYVVDDVANDGLVDTVVVSDRLLGNPAGCVPPADFPYISFGDFGASMRRPERVAVFLALVCVVVGKRANRQVGWVYA